MYFEVKKNCKYFFHSKTFSDKSLPLLMSGGKTEKHSKLLSGRFIIDVVNAYYQIR